MVINSNVILLKLLLPPNKSHTDYGLADMNINRNCSLYDYDNTSLIAQVHPLHGIER